MFQSLIGNILPEYALPDRDRDWLHKAFTCVKLEPSQQLSAVLAPPAH